MPTTLQGRITLSGGPGVTLNQTGNLLQISAAAIEQDTQSIWPHYPENILNTVTLYSGSAGAGGNSSLTTVSAYVMPFDVDDYIHFNNLNLVASNSISTATNFVSRTYSQGASIGIYTSYTTSVDQVSSKLSMVTSFTNSLLITWSTSNNATRNKMGASMYWGGGSSGTSSANTANWATVAASLSGSMLVPMVQTSNTVTITPGNYFVVAAFSHNAGASVGTLQSIGLISKSLSLPPVVGASRTASTYSPWPWLGAASMVVSSNQLVPNTFDMANITTGTGAAPIPQSSIWMQFYHKPT
jgi:hypothetical protein